jgi:DNA-binding NtrC family response regulator
MSSRAPARPAAHAPVLIVEDRDSLRTMLRHTLESRGYDVVEAADQPEAERRIESAGPGLVLSDLRLPNGDGFGVIRAAKEYDPELPVIVMTAYGSIQDAVLAMKQGALDFLAKPIDPDHLLLLVERALARRNLVAEYLLLKEELAAHRGLPEIVGDAPALKQVSLALQRAAAGDTTVLLQGESGTGKELFARALHALSGRKNGPFVAINCAAIPEALLETELFGHEKGAFTGAIGRKLGKLEVAHRGTIFLDEIGDLSLPLQAKVLRAVEEREFERVGGTSTIRVDVRVVAATNRNLRAAVAARRFREDLYFRLSVFPIVIPPLRDRREDVLRLAQHFVQRFCAELKKPPMQLSEGARETLVDYSWPGNVRELQNCIERAVILADDETIQRQHLNLRRVQALEGPSDPWDRIDLSGTLADASHRVLAEVERRKIEEALRAAAGDLGRASEILAIPYRALLAKVKEHAIATSFPSFPASSAPPSVPSR